MFCIVSQDLRISESAVDSCTIVAGSRGAGGGAANGVDLKNFMLLLLKSLPTFVRTVK